MKKALYFVSALLLITGGAVAMDKSPDEQVLIAAMLGDIPQLRSLIEQGANINAQDPELKRNALHWAITSPDIAQADIRLATVKFLIHETAIDINHPDRTKETPLFTAYVLNSWLAMDRKAIMKELLNHSKIDVMIEKDDGYSLVKSARFMSDTNKLKQFILSKAKK